MANGNGMNGLFKKAIYSVVMLMVGGLIAYGGQSIDKRVSHNEELHVRTASVDSLQNIRIAELQEGQKNAEKERRQTLNLTLEIAKTLEVPKMKIAAALLAPDTADTN